MKTLDSILVNKLIAICRGVRKEDIPNLCEALIRGGIRLIEVTFDHGSEEGMNETLHSIREIRDHFAGRLLVGAGTVLSAEEVKAAAEAGAKYIISPNVNAEVIRMAKVLGLVSVPGAMTPTEAQAAAGLGADLVKLFPADVLGLEYYKAIIAPLKHIRFVPTGGITTENMADYLRLGAAGFGIGSNLINAKQVKEGRFDLVEASARAFCQAAGQ